MHCSGKRHHSLYRQTDRQTDGRTERGGRMMVKPRQFDVILGSPRAVYRAGGVVTGSLLLHVDQPQLYTSLGLKFSGKGRVSFKERAPGSRGRQLFTNKECYLKRDIRLLPRVRPVCLHICSACRRSRFASSSSSPRRENHGLGTRLSITLRRDTGACLSRMPRRAALYWSAVQESRQDSSVSRSSRSEALSMARMLRTSRYTGAVSVAFCAMMTMAEHYQAMGRSRRGWVCLSVGFGSVANETMEAGHHEFPFTFPLPPSLPSSCECGGGSVRYCVKAKLELGWADSVSMRRYFIVFRPLDLNDHSAARCSEEQEVERPLCCLFCPPTNNMAARASIPKRGYVPGETIHVQWEVRNIWFRKIYFTIEEVVICRAGAMTGEWREILGTQRPVAQEPVHGQRALPWAHSAGSGLETITVPVAVPSGLDGCRVMDLEHRLVLHVVCVTAACSLTIPLTIMIGTTPLAPARYDSQEEEEEEAPPDYDSGYSNSQESLPTRAPAFAGPAIGADPRVNFAGPAIMGIQPPAYSPSPADGNQQAHMETLTAQTELVTTQVESVAVQMVPATAQTEVATAQTEATTVQTEVATAQTEVATAQTEATTAQTEATTAQMEVATAQTEATTAQTEATTAQTEVTTAQTEATTAQTEVATAQTETVTAHVEMVTAHVETLM
ncbi:hypothetical protein ACOMHN_022905 [Nucella lapillus]